jgi:hypothetical protein
VALGKYQEAMAAIEAGMKLQHDWPRAHFNPRRDFYRDLEDEWLDHMKLLQAVQAKHPEQPAYVFLVAYQCWFDGDRDEASRVFREVRPRLANPALADAFLTAAAEAGPRAGR